MSTGQDVVAKFTSRLATSARLHSELLLAAYGKRRQASLESMLVEQFVFYIAVLWELFINDLLLTYLVMSPESYLKQLGVKLQQSTRERFGVEASKCVAFRRPTTLSLQRAALFADPKGYNLGANSADALTKRANDLLAAPFAKKFTLGPDDTMFIDFMIALRNYLGHRSARSRKTLKENLANLAGVNANLQAPLHNVPTYLKTRVGNDPRSLLIANRLIAVAQKLG